MLGVSVAGFPRARIDPPTLIGVSAVLMWSATVGLYRNISETFGAVGGSALIFTFSGIVATLYGGRAAFRGHSPRYLLLGGAMFVTYEIALALAIGFAQDRTQTIEVGMVNYLWPCFTIAFAVWVGEARGDFRIVPGVILCLAGVVLASSGGGAVSLHAMIGNVSGNPAPYLMAFAAAVTWPLYTIFTRRMSGGRSAVPPLLLLTAALLWIYYFASDQPPLHFDLRGLSMALLFGVLTTLAYSAWTYGVTHGNLTLLATASYFTPLLSVMLSSFLLNMLPGLNFWGGAVLVTGGSLVCWRASRR
ncbi:DMT transporter permease [Kaistia sp. 32K]|uniref:aromatic amino acid DMT transporter YddG n=1 Tax=Kaistia sp. 32K TaxID=2795690 RepID=UPI001914EC72|nr:aromatic amino acid DMT transporter YddG [Kaistia sp. 32K]BCP53220.1 DMT transporter permease [Kaistia sp. 32K]